MISIYLVVLLTAKKAYIQGKRLFSNDVIMEEFWSLENNLLGLRSGIEWRTACKTMYQTHRMYLPAGRKYIHEKEKLVQETFQGQIITFLSS